MSITALPTPPSRQRPTTFSSEGDTFLAALPTFVTEANDQAADIASTADEIDVNVNSAYLAAQTANFKGVWSDLTGALAIPSSVLHSGSYWMLLSNLADVTLKEPGVDPEWEVISIDTSSTGGKKVWSVSTNTTLTSERLNLITTTVDNLYISLPLPTSSKEGGPLYVLSNTGDYKFYVKNYDGDIIGELEQGATAIIMLDDSADKKYSFLNVNLDHNSISTGTPTVIKTSTTTYSSACMVASNKVLVVYVVSTTMYAVVLTISGLDISIGAEVSLATVNSKKPVVCRVEDNKALVTYCATSTVYATAGIITVTGTVPAMGTPISINSTSCTVYDLIGIDTNKFVVAYAETTSGYCRVISISGATITVGTAPTATTVDNAIDLYLTKISASKFLFTFSATLYTKVGTITDTSISLGSQVALSGSSYYFSYIVVESESLIYCCSYTALATDYSSAVYREFSITGTVILQTNTITLPSSFLTTGEEGFTRVDLQDGRHLFVKTLTEGLEVYTAATRGKDVPKHIGSSRVIGVTKPLSNKYKSLVTVDTNTFVVMCAASSPAYEMVFVVKVG